MYLFITWNSDYSFFTSPIISSPSSCKTWVMKIKYAVSDSRWKFPIGWVIFSYNVRNWKFLCCGQGKQRKLFLQCLQKPTWAWEHAGTNVGLPWTAGIFRIISDKAGGPLTNATRRQFNVRRSSPENSLISIYRGVRIKLTFTKTYDVKFQLLLSAASGSWVRFGTLWVTAFHLSKSALTYKPT